VRIDLHTHSNASDGTCTPTQLVEAGAEAKLEIIAITDHDTYAGWDEAANAAGGILSLSLVRGVEMSCRSSEGISLHMLGLLVDPTHQDLATALEQSRDDRIPRMKAIVKKMQNEGFDISFADVEAQLSEGATLGRPHLADALVAKGIVPDRDSAFRDYLHNNSRFYVGHFASDALDGVRLIKAAGGIAIFAHPGAAKRGSVVSPEFIAEVDHRDHDEKTRQDLRALAAELGLLTTGSSDFHGTGKMNALGENLTSPEVWEQLKSRATGIPVLENKS
jgi:3',5'-nucleoside bisphosphate phosphatase